MAENHTLPPDLIRLQTAYSESDAAVAVYVMEIEAARRLEFPDPPSGWSSEQATRRTAWPQEQVEELERLRAARLAALNALWQHPDHATTLSSGHWKELKEAACTGTT